MSGLNHPRLAHAIMALRPGTLPLKDFLVVDHGDGPVLQGSMVNPPTQAEVDAVTVEQLDAAQASKVRDPTRPLTAEIESLKTRLTVAEAQVSEIETLKTRLEDAEAKVSEIDALKDRLTEVEKKDVPPIEEPPLVEEPPPL